MFHTHSKLILATLVAVAGAIPYQATAEVLPYGNFGGADVMFIDVVEDTGDDEPEGLFGAPDVVASNTLDFDPLRFTSSAPTNTADMSFVDGLLNFTLMSTDNSFDIMNVRFYEAGDYSLIGVGAAQASAKVEAEVDYAVTHVNGDQLIQALVGTGAVVFTPDSVFDLNGSNTNGQWTGTLNVDVRALLDSKQIVGAATKINFVVRNAQTTETSEGGVAFVAKKDFSVSILGEIVPEPSGLSLILPGLFACLQRCRRR